MTDSALRDLDDLTDGIRVAMLVLHRDTGIDGRPLTVQKIDGDAVWFLVGDQAEWLGDVDGPVNVTFVDDKTWVSVSGTGALFQDPKVVEELGDPVSDAWFQEGQSPLALRVDVEHGEWWTAPTFVRAAIGVAKAKVTGTTPDIGDHGEVTEHATATSDDEGVHRRR